jgi:hypothetical protein
MTATTSTITTYIVAMRDNRGKLLSAEGETDYGRAKRKYTAAVTTFNGGGYGPDCTEVALVKVTDRTQTTLRSTTPQTARAKAQRGMVA